DRARVALLPLEVIGDLLAPASLDMTVQAVVRDVHLAADEPLGERDLPLEHRVIRLVPGDVLLRLLGPQALGVSCGRFEEALILRPRLGEELRARRERASLVEQGVDSLGPLAHRDLLTSVLTELIA